MAPQSDVTKPSNFHDSRSVCLSSQSLAQLGAPLTALYEHMMPCDLPSITHARNGGR